MPDANVSLSFTTTGDGAPPRRMKPSRFKGIVWAAVLSFVISLGAVGHGHALYASMTLPEMFEHADLVITGQVAGSSDPYLFAETPGASPTYWRDVYVHADSTVKGTPKMALLDEGLVREGALDGFLEPDSGESTCVVVVRTQVDSHNGISVSTGVGEIADGTEALFFLYSTDDPRTDGSYNLLRGELGVLTPDADGAYLGDDGNPFTLEDLAALATAPGFADVPESVWYGGEDGCVAYVAERGVMSGYAGTGLFGPEDPLTRAQAVTALYRLVEGDPANCTSDAGVYSEIADTSGFSDAVDGAYYTAALNWAASEGVTRGSAGIFRPNDPITREELVTMVGRAVDNAPARGDISCEDISIADADQISAWAKHHIEWGFRYVIHGDFIGFSDHLGTSACLIRPLDFATRAEGAKILMCLSESVIEYKPWA